MEKFFFYLKKKHGNMNVFLEYILLSSKIKKIIERDSFKKKECPALQILNS